MENIKKPPYIQSKKIICQLSTIFYFILKSYSTQGSEFTCQKLGIQFCWIRIRSNTVIPDPDPGKSSGSRSWEKFRIPILGKVPDPDPGKSSGSMRIWIHNTAYLRHFYTVDQLMPFNDQRRKLLLLFTWNLTSNSSYF